MSKPSSKANKAAALGVVALGAGLVAGAYGFACYATSPPRRRVKPWNDPRLPVEEVSFRSRDDILLRGWFAPCPHARATIVLCHGHPANRVETVSRARFLFAAGFHVLMFDFRAMGESEGERSGIGMTETQDLAGALDYLDVREETKGLPIGVYGHSMGGAVAIRTAAEDRRIRAVVSHGAFASLETAIAQRARLLSGPFAPLFAEMIGRFGEKRMGFPTQAHSPISVIHQIAPRPILIVHGGKDIIIRPQDGRDLFAAAAEPKAFHLFPKSPHISLHPAEETKYVALLTQFFLQSLTP